MIELQDHLVTFSHAESAEFFRREHRVSFNSFFAGFAYLLPLRLCVKPYFLTQRAPSFFAEDAELLLITESFVHILCSIFATTDHSYYLI